MWKQVRRGWCLGDEEFRAELLAAMKSRHSEYIAGDEIKESEAHKAERILKEALARLDWTQKDLRTTLKGDKRKVRISPNAQMRTTSFREFLHGTSAKVPFSLEIL